MAYSFKHSAFLWMACLVTAGFLTACADSTDKTLDDDVANAPPVEELYNTALDTLEQSKYKKASDQFDEVEQQYPYSQWATKAQLMSSYADYMNGDYDDAIIGLERFIQLHPSHEDIAYAYYLKALAYYDQITDIGRDQLVTKRALESLSDIVRRFPESQYAKDAQLKIDLATDHLAGKEMSIGRFYLKRGNQLAAVNRFKYVVDHYQTTTHVPEALHRLVEAYVAMGLRDEAKKTAAVLGYNYPGSRWYADSYALLTGEKILSEEEQSWFKKQLEKVF